MHIQLYKRSAPCGDENCQKRVVDPEKCSHLPLWGILWDSQEKCLHFNIYYYATVNGMPTSVEVSRVHRMKKNHMPKSFHHFAVSQKACESGIFSMISDKVTSHLSVTGSVLEALAGHHSDILCLAMLQMKRETCTFHLPACLLGAESIA